MEEQQIEVAGVPEVRIAFDNGTHSVQVGVKNVANLDFVLAMLEMAKVSITFQRNMAMAAQVDAQQAEIRKAQQIANSLRNGGMPR